jgi:hypothetical protein
MTRTTHTFVVLDLSGAAFAEISTKLKDAGYHHAFSKDDGRDVIDMQGIAVACEPEPSNPAATVEMPKTREEAAILFARHAGVGADLSVLLRVRPTARELANAKCTARANGVPSHVIERAAELIA